MTVVAVFIMVITTCSVPGIESSCRDDLVSDYVYPTAEDCSLDLEAVRIPNAQCIPANVARASVEGQP